MRKLAYFLGLLLATLVTLFLVRGIDIRFNGSQILSILIFSMFIYGTLFFGEFRLAFAFGGIALLLSLKLLTVPRFVEAASLDVITFLIGTFLVIGYLEECGFFEHVVARIVAVIGPRPQLLLLTMMIMATVASALVGEVTSILFMSGAMLHLTTKYKLSPVPFVIMLVFATNIGSAASSVGNPIGVLIALKAELTFMDFLRWAAPIALVVNVVTYLICRWWFADAFREFGRAVQREHAEHGQSDRAGAVQSEAPMNPERQMQLRIAWMVFGLLILLLVTHGLTEKLLGLKEGTMMVGAALAVGSLVLLLSRERARELVERRVDWWTLSFFMMLFASVGTLEHTQVTRVVAQRLISSTGDNPTLLVHLVGWSTGWLSAFLDNVLAVATFMPVVHDVRAAASPQGFTGAIYWSMLFGGTFMGNMTVIGSTANIVAVGLLEKRGHGTISFWYWMKIGFIVSIASMVVASLLLAAQWQLIPMMPAPNAAGVAPH